MKIAPLPRWSHFGSTFFFQWTVSKMRFVTFDFLSISGPQGWPFSRRGYHGYQSAFSKLFLKAMSNATLFFSSMTWQIGFGNFFSLAPNFKILLRVWPNSEYGNANLSRFFPRKPTCQAKLRQIIVILLWRLAHLLYFCNEKQDKTPIPHTQNKTEIIFNCIHPIEQNV